MRMVHHAVMSVSVCALSLLSLTSPSQARDKHEKKCREVSGTFSSVTVPNCPDSPVGLCTQGVLEGELAGDYYFIFESFTPHPTDSTKTTYTGTSVITTEDGVIYTDDTGVVDAVPFDQPAEFVTTAEIVDGTGRYEKRGGEFIAAGTLVFGSAAGSYEATLCKEEKHQGDDRHDGSHGHGHH